MINQWIFLHVTEFCGGLISVAIALSPCYTMVPPSKNRNFFIKSPRSTTMALMDKPNDLVRVDSTIMYIFTGRKQRQRKVKSLSQD